MPSPLKPFTDLKSCIQYYESLNEDGDSKNDWSIRGQRSGASTLFPSDDDLDGDGLTNLMDPEPHNQNISKFIVANNGVPDHLALKGSLGPLQGDLYKRHRILAVNHTDDHSPLVLQSLLLLLDHALPKESWRLIKSFQVLYAFKSHDSKIQIAAYHPQLNAISIAGKNSYSDSRNRPPTPRTLVPILSSLAHEMGHAFVFDQLSKSELRDLGIQFGNWLPVLGEAPLTDLYDPAFFKPHPLRALGRMSQLVLRQPQTPLEQEIWRTSNLTSEYALQNLHEWFADAFAAYLLQRLGNKGLLSDRWQTLLSRTPSFSGGYWVNYNNLNDDFKQWFDQRLRVETP